MWTLFRYRYNYSRTYGFRRRYNWWQRWDCRIEAPHQGKAEVGVVTRGRIEVPHQGKAEVRVVTRGRIQAPHQVEAEVEVIVPHLNEG